MRKQNKQTNKKVVRLFRIVFLSAELANPSRRSARAWWHVATRGQRQADLQKWGFRFRHKHIQKFGKNALFWKIESSKFEGAGFCEFNLRKKNLFPQSPPTLTCASNEFLTFPLPRRTSRGSSTLQNLAQIRARASVLKRK